MKFTAIRTRVLQPPKDDLYVVLDESLPHLQERDVLFITSKIAAIHQGRCVPMNAIANKDELIAKEADRHLPRALTPGGLTVLTVKGSTLLPAAGIDESNGNGYYVLWPTTPNEFAAEVCFYLKKKYSLRDLGIVLTDSHCVPLRRGVVGVAIGFSGFRPVRSNIGQPDIFGRPLKVTTINVVDALAASAVLLMGESNEQTPLVLARDIHHLEFTDENCTSDLYIPTDQDLYAPLLKVFEDPTLNVKE